MKPSVLTFVVLLSIAFGASAQRLRCRSGEGNCAKCNKARSKCLKCYDTYSPNSKGQCVQCKVPGPLGDFCVVCNGNKPNVCLRCSDWEGERVTGLYATKAGRCLDCPDKNCHRCASISGRCLECARGYGLVGNKCVKCADAECITCNRNAAVCTSCFSGSAPNPRGVCKPCRDKNCDVCATPSRCEFCSMGYTLKGGKCVKA